MASNCVSDEQIILAIQGIRHVIWGLSSSANYGHVNKPWHVTVTYKNNHTIFYYNTEAEAKNIFNKVRLAMDKEFRGNKNGE